MTEQQENRRIFSLLEVTQSVQRTLHERYSSSFWVKAEMNKLNHYPHSGHAYPDLVEKKDSKIIAQLRSILWRDDYIRINNQFLRVLKTPLKDGIKMLFCARITFDPVHGLSLRIIDIDPVFSLGELEREKQQAIDTLKKEHLFDRNRLLPLPAIPQRVAVISVQTSKGYADFLKVIEQNSYRFKFFHVLFPSLLQGDKAIDSILFQLERIRQVLDHFDVVAIIRGGGGEVGLSSFNDLQLARAIATFPIPVLTGIGHATNETVAEMVSFRNAITPTDLANFLIQKFLQALTPVQQSEQRLLKSVNNLLDEQRREVYSTGRYFRSVTQNILQRSKHSLERVLDAVTNESLYRLRKEKQAQVEIRNALSKTTADFQTDQRESLHHIKRILLKDVRAILQSRIQFMDGLERTVNNLDPKNVLKRGFSITRLEGKLVRSSEDLKRGVTIETELFDGIISSEVKAVKPENNDV